MSDNSKARNISNLCSDVVLYVKQERSDHPEKAADKTVVSKPAPECTTTTASTMEPDTTSRSYDNRGIGRTTRSTPGPYTASLLAHDLHGLLTHLSVPAFHLLGVSMGGMITQAYALHYPNPPSIPRSPALQIHSPTLLTLTLACTYAAPSPFCTRMFALWADMAAQMSVRDVMRDVLLWAFTVPFFRERGAELAAMEAAMAALDMSGEDYLAQLDVIRRFDSTGELVALGERGEALCGLRQGRVMVLAGEEDILIPVVLSRELARLVPGAVWRTTRGGHGCMWEFPEEFNRAYLAFLKGA